MKKTFYPIISAAMAIALTSCGSSISTEKTLSTQSVGMYGNQSEYVSVVGDSCTLKYNLNKGGDSGNPTITVTFQLEKEVGELENLIAKYGNIDLSLIDQDGGSINTDEFTPNLLGYDKLENLLKGKVGDQVKVTFEYPWYMSYDEMKLAQESAASFEINDLDFTQTYSVASDDDSDSNSSSDYDSNDNDYADNSSATSSDSDDSSEWDEILDEYESFVDDYVSIAKKAKNGDVTALTESASMMQSALSLNEKLSGAKSNLSASQLSRYTSITAKYAAAAL